MRLAYTVGGMIVDLDQPLGHGHFLRCGLDEINAELLRLAIKVNQRGDDVSTEIVRHADTKARLSKAVAVSALSTSKDSIAPKPVHCRCMMA